MQAGGFQGSVDEFNQKVPLIVNAYRNTHGASPPPGLVLDIARSPVEPDQYNRLFDPSFLNPSIARLQGTLAQHDRANPTVVRPDGMLVTYTALTAPLQAAHVDIRTEHSPTPAPARADASKYPWVPAEAGFLPVSDFGKLVNAVGDLLKGGADSSQAQLTVGGKTLDQYQQELNQTNTFRGGAAASYQADVLGAAKTVKDAQQELQDKYPAYFTGLPLSGNFSADWVHAVARFQTSNVYFAASTKRLAQDNHFGDNTGEFVKAWREKQHLIRTRPMDAAALERLPLAWFGTSKSVLNALDGDTHGWGWINVPTVALGTVAGVGKGVFAGAAALSAGFKADMASHVEFLNHVAPAYLGGKGEGLKEAHDHALKVARENPTWLRVLYPDIPDTPDQAGWLKAVDQGTNFVGDVVLGNKLVVGGSAVKLADRAGFASNRYVKGALPLAFNSMKRRGLDGVGEASKLVQGGEAFNVRAAEAIKDGRMSLGQYQAHIADLYHTGKTSLDGKLLRADRPIDTVLSTLREKNLPNTSLVRQRVKATLDQYEQGLRASNIPGTDNAANMWSAVRQQFQFVTPARARIFDPKAPDDLYNWVVSHLGDRELAQKARNDLVVARSTDDIPAVQALNQGLVERYAALNPNMKGKPAPPLGDGPELESESLTYLKLLTGRQPIPTGPLDRLEQSAQRMNGRLNTLAAIHREVIIGLPGTGESLFFKHMVADTGRRFAGGGGLRFDLSKAQEAARTDLQGYFRANPEAMRDYGFNRAMSEQGEAHYIKANRVDDVATFNTGDPAFQGKKHQEAAGSYLRAMLQDNALTAYRASTASDKTPLFRHVWDSSFFQNKIAMSEDFKREARGVQTLDAAKSRLAEIDATYEEVLAKIAGGYEAKTAKGITASRNVRNSRVDPARRLPTVKGEARKLAEKKLTVLLEKNAHPTMQRLNKMLDEGVALKEGITAEAEASGKWRTAALSDLKKQYAQDWVDTLYSRYKAVEDAGAKANVPDVLDQAQQVAIQHVGAHADEQLGKFVADNKLAFDVNDAPIRSSRFDGAMQWWIEKLMTMNKLNRRVFFDHTFYSTYDELLKGGWERPQAIAASTQLARAQTVYHMLDFSHMLQVEQNLRWVSYFATKHRLYWSWIAQQFAHKPLLAAAVQDVGNHLQNGNLNVDVQGHSLRVPVARLFWTNNTEYPQTSPLVEVMARAGANLAEGKSSLGGDIGLAFSQETATSGNVFTRIDQTAADLVKYTIALSGGRMTYGVAIEGMSQVQRRAFNEEMHNYVLSYRAHHNGQYPAEQDAVKATLLRATLLEGWRANLFLPVLLNTGPTNEIQKLHARFDKLTDPKARSNFLNAHPKLADSFGASADQALYLHNAPLWDAFRQATTRRDAAMTTLRNMIDSEGYSADLAKQVKAVSAQYRADIQRIRTQDARTWAGNATYPAGKVADNGEVTASGPWSQQLDGNPVASTAFLHELFPGITAPELSAHTIGQTVVDLQAEATRIHELGWQKLGYPDKKHASERLSQIFSTISTLQSLPKNPTSQMVSTYYAKYVDPYIKERDKLKVLRASTKSVDKDAVYALTRAIQERFDHPVTVTNPANGKQDEFPSPVSFGFTMLPPDEYRTALAGAVSGRWQDITGYEKTLLGVKTPTHVAEGWLAYQKTIGDYRRVPTNPGLVAEQRLGLAQQIDKVYPGFLSDWKFSNQPKVQRYESTTLYKTLPTPLRTEFDKYVASTAQQIVALIKRDGHAAYYVGQWRTYVREQLEPWLNERAQRQLKAELARYGTDFLDTLPSAG